LVSTFSPEGLIEIRWFIGYFQFVSCCHLSKQVKSLGFPKCYTQSGSKMKKIKRIKVFNTWNKHR